MQARTVKGIEEIAPMRDDWDAVVKASRGTIFQSHAFTMAWLKRFSDRAAIEVSVVQKDGKTVAILPAASHGVKIMKMNARVLSPVGVCGAENEYHSLGPMLAAEDDESLDSLVKEMSKHGFTRGEIESSIDHLVMHSVLVRTENGVKMS